MTSTDASVLVAKKKEISNMVNTNITVYKPLSPDIVNGNVRVATIGIHQVARYQDTSST